MAIQSTKEKSRDYIIREKDIVQAWRQLDENKDDQCWAQINLIFSVEIGAQPQMGPSAKKRKEKNFLNEQFIVLQEYIENEDHRPRPFCLK